MLNFPSHGFQLLINTSRMYCQYGIFCYQNLFLPIITQDRVSVSLLGVPRAMLNLPTAFYGYHNWFFFRKQGFLSGDSRDAPPSAHNDGAGE